MATWSADGETLRTVTIELPSTLASTPHIPAIGSSKAELPSGSSVVRYVDELDVRRSAPLPSGLVGLAVASSVLFRRGGWKGRMV